MNRAVLKLCLIAIMITSIIGTLEAQILQLKPISLNQGRAVWSNCRGKRLDTLGITRYITANECIEMGGDCCGVNKDGIGNGSDDPKTMAPMDKCYSCYNGAVKAICTGKLVRTQIGLQQDWWVNSKNCIKAGGLCCDGTATTTNPAVFDPKAYPDADFCNNCYSGSVQNTTEKGSCSGKLLANNDYRARTCTFFGGSCCDDDASSNPSLGGSAFKASMFPDARCKSCFGGELMEIRWAQGK